MAYKISQKCGCIFQVVTFIVKRSDRQVSLTIYTLLSDWDRVLATTDKWERSTFTRIFSRRHANARMICSRISKVPDRNDKTSFNTNCHLSGSVCSTSYKFLLIGTRTGYWDKKLTEKFDASFFLQDTSRPRLRFYFFHNKPLDRASKYMCGKQHDEIQVSFCQTSRRSFQKQIILIYSRHWTVQISSLVAHLLGSPSIISAAHCVFSDKGNWPSRHFLTMKVEIQNARTFIASTFQCFRWNSPATLVLSSRGDVWNEAVSRFPDRVTSGEECGSLHVQSVCGHLFIFSTGLGSSVPEKRNAHFTKPWPPRFLHTCKNILCRSPTITLSIGHLCTGASVLVSTVVIASATPDFPQSTADDKECFSARPTYPSQFTDCCVHLVAFGPDNSQGHRSEIDKVTPWRPCEVRHMYRRVFCAGVMMCSISKVFPTGRKPVCSFCHPSLNHPPVDSTHTCHKCCIFHFHSKRQTQCQEQSRSTSDDQDFCFFNKR